LLIGETRDYGVKAHPGHAPVKGAPNARQVNLPHFTGQQSLCGRTRIEVDSEAFGKVVSRAQGKNPQRNFASNQPPQSVVHSAVTSCRDHYGGRLFASLASQLDQVTGVPAFADLWLDAGAAQDFECSRQFATPGAPACGRVVKNRYLHGINWKNAESEQ
jgi:hypothetical protein